MLGLAWGGGGRKSLGGRTAGKKELGSKISPSGWSKRKRFPWTVDPGVQVENLLIVKGEPQVETRFGRRLKRTGSWKGLTAVKG